MANSHRKNADFRNLIAALLADEWTENALTSRAGKALGQRFRYLRPFVRRVLARFPTPPDFDELLRFAAADEKLTRAVDRDGITTAKFFVVRAKMTPHRAVAAWPVPPFTTIQAVEDWLRLDRAALDWYADTSGRTANARSPRLRHYRHVWVPKANNRSRLLESPKDTLKRLQRKVLSDVLDHVPPHAAAHGFRRGRSVVTNASPHCGRAVVIRFDLTEFFPSIAGGQVFALFRTLGYPADVAWVLTGLCTTRLSRDVWEARPDPAPDGSDHGTWVRLASRHLPQGAPTSPALANLVAYRLDCRLAALADSLDATYTRYADDLTFSGGSDLSAGAIRLGKMVAGIAREEGFAVNPQKTRVMRRGSRQTVAGVVVNVRPNVVRANFDMLKAILTNCRRHGPTSQNRDQIPDIRRHLAGRVAHVANLNPARGRQLWAIFDRIDWTR